MGYPDKANWTAQPAASVALRYGLALVSVAAALGLARASLYFHLPQPFTALALSAIAVTFWYGGTNPGILAVLLSLLVRDFFFEPEVNVLSRVLYSLVFVIFALVMIRVTRTRNELERRVAERTAELSGANKDLKLEIAERKQAEEALRESEQQFRDYAEIASDWLWETGPDHRFTRVSRHLDFVGRLPPSRIGVTPSDYATDVESHPEQWQRHRAMLDAHQPFRDFLYSAIRQDGSTVYLRTSGKPFFDGNGSFLGYRGVATDVTAAVRADQAEEALRNVQAELAHVTRVTTLGELAASIAHEVNQPLAAIVTNGAACLRWLARDVPDIDEVRGAVERMINDGNRAAEVIRRVRALSKKTDAMMAPLPVNEVIDEAILLLRHEVLSHRALLRVELASELPLVRGDRIQLQQVIINLAMNGMEAMAPVTGRARELKIRSRREADAVLVAVEDSGVGIEPEHVDQLFNAFFTTKTGGMGMGLSICRSIIEAHGGKLWASRNVGAGATFQFTLPAYQEHAS